MAGKEQSENAERGTFSRLFGDLSVAQLIAGALAAATSLLLSTKIGIAGSVIGVAVGSIVSAVAGNMYKRFLQASADKLKEVAVDSVELILPGTKRRLSDSDGDSGGDSCKDAVEAELDEGSDELPDDRLAVAEADNAVIANLSEDELLLALSDCADAAVAKAREQWRHEQQVQRRLVAVSVLSALVAVGATALLVFALTSGQGLGEKAPIITPIVQAERSIAGSADTADSADASAEDSQQHSDDSSAGKDAAKNNEATSSDESVGSDGGSQSGSASGESGASGGSNDHADSDSGGDGGVSGGSSTLGGSGTLSGSDASGGSGSSGSAAGNGNASGEAASGSGGGSASSESASSRLSVGGSAIHPVN